MPQNSFFPKSISLIKGFYQYIFTLVKSFIADNCQTKASALAFYSLLSIVPFLAVLFGIAQEFGFGNALENTITSRLIQQPEIADKLIEFAYTSLKNTQGSIIASIGIITLLWTVLGLLNNVETVFNEIWKIPTGRSYGKKFRDYITVLFVAPFFLVGASSMNIYLTTQLKQDYDNLIVEAVTPVLLMLLKLFPFLLMWMLMTFIYTFIPNTKAHIKANLVAGLITGTLFQLWQWVYIRFQIGVSSYGAIYGSFAAVPLFMMWLQIGWLIVLAGAELAVKLKTAKS